MGLVNFFKSLFAADQSKTLSSLTDKSAQPTKAKKQTMMRYLLNDPATPNLTLDMALNLRPTVCPAFTVNGFVGNRMQMWTKEWRAAQIHHAFLNTLHTMQPAFKRPPKKWPATKRLVVCPQFGRDLNAYYDRRRLCFFFDKDPVTKKMVFTGHSVDIVAHELGHALLDAVRPGLWNKQSLEIWSFHEAWSDIVAMLTVMKHERVLEYVLKETGGDFTKSNIVSRLGEEMGNAVYHMVGGKYGYKPGRLRDANNRFIYRTPEKLPKEAPDDKLARECHSFGRVFLGAFYELMTKIYQHEAKTGCDKITALKRTRHLCAMLIARAAQMAPATPRFYDAVGRAILGVDKGNGGKYSKIIKRVFDSRKILSRRSIKVQKSVNLQDIDIKENDQVEEYEDLTTIRQQSVQTVRLADHFGVRAQANNPLYYCEIDIPNETYMEFDRAGNMIDSIATSPRVAVNSARECIKLIHENDMVADGPVPEDDFRKQFSVINGKLVRNFFI